MKISIKDLVKGNEVHFDSYRKGNLYYTISFRGREYLFPVPLDDTGAATLVRRERAILFMRYINRAMKEGSFVPLAS